MSATVLAFFGLIFLFSINYASAIAEQSLNKYGYYLMVMTVSLLTTFHFRNNRQEDLFIKRLYFVLKVIVIHACINVLIYGIVKDSVVTISNLFHECQTFANVFFYSSLQKKFTLMSFVGFDFYRNQGLFWEAGVLQVFLNIFLYLELFIFKKSKFWVLLAIFSILTTYSTTGISILLIQIVYYIKYEMKNRKVLIPFVLVLSFPVYLIFSVNVEEKIVGDQEASFQKRYFDLVQPLFIALQNPLTGIGLDLDKFQEYRSSFYFESSLFNSVQDKVGLELKMDITDQGSSNSFMFLLSTMGFPTFILFIYMFFNQIIFNQRKYLLFSIIILSLMTSPLLLRPFFFLFIMSGFMHTFYKITSHNKKLL
ncbi:MAG: O-antigen ligase family protein [Flavobacteriales bacterium]|nr:O-antigen ligase family protein [Flavobacteriales bacterium]